VAKVEMICPFSGKLCKECPIFRGRHYNLCFSKKYRGHLDKSGKVTKVGNFSTLKASPSKEFEIPSIARAKAIDPFTTTLKDIK